MIGSHFQNGCLMLAKNKKADDTWFLRFYEDREGKRVYRKQRIGTVKEFPRRRDAEKAALVLRTKINSEVRSPESVNDLIAHYSKHELTPERKAFATLDSVLSYLKLYVSPVWGASRVTEVRTVAVEKWLDVSSSHRVPRPRSGTSCPPSSITASGTSGLPSIRL